MLCWEKMKPDNGSAPAKSKSKPRPGTGISGKEYEVFVPAYFALKLLDSESVEDFVFASNIRDHGALDDVILTVTLSDGRVRKFAFQLKHSERKKYIEPSSFGDVKGDFCLHKYCEDYGKIDPNFCCIIYTNYGFDPKNTKKVTRFGMYSDAAGPEEEFINTSSSLHNIYRFRTNELTENNDRKLSRKDYEKFFGNFFLYVGQKNSRDFEKAIVDHFKTTYGAAEGTADSYVNLFRRWHKNEYSSMELRKEDVRFRLIDVLITPYALNLPVTEPKSDVLKAIAEEFDAVVAEDLDEDFVRKHWKKIACHLDNSEVLRLGKQYKFVVKDAKELTEDTKHKILRYARNQPLIIKVGKECKHLIGVVARLFKGKSDRNGCILLLKKADEEALNLRETAASSGLRLFRDLSDLFARDKDKCGEIARQLRVSLQGREEVSVEEILEVDRDVMKLLRVKELVRMLDGDFVIGGEKEALPEHYLSRKVLATTLTVDALDKVRNDVLIVSCDGRLEEFKAVKVTNGNSFDLEDYLSADFEEKVHNFPTYTAEENCSRELVVTNGECTRAQFEKIASNDDRNVHHLRMVDGATFEWVRSKGSLEELKKRKPSRRHVVEDSRVYDRFTHEVNVVCAQPGAGKSTMINYLRNRCPCGFWTIKVSLGEHDAFFKIDRDEQEILDYFLNAQPLDNDDFAVELRQIYLRKKRVYFYLDGLDELDSDCIDSVLNCVQKLSSRGYRQWVSSRCNLRERLENKLGVFSVDVAEIDEENQKNYVRSRLSHRAGEEVDRIVAKLYENIRPTVGVLGLPLQLFMMTEILMDRSGDDGQFIEKISVLTRMYRCFVEGRYAHYMNKIKSACRRSLLEIVTDSQESRLKKYQLAAFRACLGPASSKHFPDLAVADAVNDECNKFLQTIRDKADFLGIILRVGADNSVVFYHHTYAEYFLASWMANNAGLISKFQEFIFEERYDNVRFFFDVMLAEENPLHLEVLYRDVDGLKRQIEGGERANKDRGGRSPLHIASSWGTRHHLLEMHQVGGKPVFRASSLKDECSSYSDMLASLTELFDPTEPDGLFELSSIEYADRTHSLSAIDRISSVVDRVDLDRLRNFRDQYSVSYYCVKFDYARLFHNSLKKIPFFHLDDGKNLLGLAVDLERASIVRSVLRSAAYADSIDENHLLHLASARGNLEIVRDLVKADADVDRVDEDGQTALFKAVICDHPGVAKYLIDMGATVNVADTSGNSPLIYAARGAKAHIVKLLVEEGHADVNMENKNEETALTIAGKEGCLNTLRYLQRKCGTEKRKAASLSLVDLARSGDLGTIRQLVERGDADVHEVDGGGQSPLMIALENGHEDVVEYLLLKKGELIKNEFYELLPI